MGNTSQSKCSGEKNLGTFLKKSCCKSVCHTKGQLLDDSSYMMVLISCTVTFIALESGMVVARGWERGRWRFSVSGYRVSAWENEKGAGMVVMVAQQ